MDIRKITGGFFVLVLLFCQPSGESDNVNVDLLLAYRTSFVAVGCHCERMCKDEVGLVSGRCLSFVFLERIEAVGLAIW